MTAPRRQPPQSFVIHVEWVGGHVRGRTANGDGTSRRRRESQSPQKPGHALATSYHTRLEFWQRGRNRVPGDRCRGGAHTVPVVKHVTVTPNGGKGIEKDRLSSRSRSRQRSTVRTRLAKGIEVDWTGELAEEYTGAH